MTRWQRRQRRKDEVKARAKVPNHMYSYCRIIGCGRPARAGTSDGLDQRYCRAHTDHYQRHGSVLKDSYKSGEINPYRRAALEWIISNEGDFWVANAIQRVQGLYDRAGPHIEAFRLRGKAPGERAKAAWARLRRHETDPRLPLAAWLAVEMIVRDDPQPVLTNEFKRVQAAKIVHRMASGSHKRWEMQIPDPNWSGQRTKTVVQEMHTYPRPRGRVLRHIGEALEEAVELLVDHNLEAIHAFTREHMAASGVGGRPWPKGWSSRPRKIPA